MENNNQPHQGNKILVLLNEEYGFRLWFWYPQMSALELETWWASLETVVPYFFDPSPLPGELIYCKDKEQWEQYGKENVHYYAHLHCDEDSYLSNPSKKRILHLGYGKESFPD